MKPLFGFAFLPAFVLLAAAPAKASAIFDWTVSIPIVAGGNITGSGQLVAQGNLVLSITGTYGGSAITGLAPVNSPQGNDNQVFPGQTPLLSGAGIAFFVSPNVFGTNVVDIYFISPGYSDLGPTGVTGTFTLTASSIPEPTTVSLLSFSLLAGICLNRRFKTRTSPQRNLQSQ